MVGEQPERVAAEGVRGEKERRVALSIAAARSSRAQSRKEASNGLRAPDDARAPELLTTATRLLEDAVAAREAEPGDAER